MPSVSMELLLFGGRALVLLLGFATLIVCFTRWHGASRRTALEAAERIEVTVGELRALRELGEALGAQVQTLSEQVQTHLRLAKAASAPGATGYDVALRLARNGVSTEEVIASSGVTRQEAELLARLHGPGTGRHKMSA
jgi:Flp pilus assembly protein TadB